MTFEHLCVIIGVEHEIQLHCKETPKILTLSTITSQFASVGVLNDNFQSIADWANNALTRDGGSLTGDLDMNGHRILNLPAPESPTDPVRLVDLQTGGLDIDDLVPPQAGNANKFLYTDGTTVSWAVAPGTPGAGISQITAGTGLTGGVITTTGIIALADTTVTPGSYGSATAVATFTVDAQGRLSQAATTPIAITKAQVTDLGTIGSAAALNATDVALVSGTTFTGDITRSGRGHYLHHNATNLVSGRIFIQPAGTPPAMDNGDFLFEW